ncbi:MAG: hypothetical protein AAB225_28035 [Acidobacteriota bacterium]
MTWKLKLTETGFDLTADVAARQGAQTYSLPQAARLLDLSVDPSTGHLTGSGFRLTRGVMVRADGIQTPCSAWGINGANVSFTCDDSDFPAEAFPYVIDPSGSFYPTAAGDDAFAEVANYGISGCPAWPGGLVTQYLGDTTTFTVNFAWSRSSYSNPICYKYSRQSYIRFDTSSIPSGATISSASVNVNASAVDDGNQNLYGGAGCSVQADWYASANWPLTQTEWNIWGAGNAVAPQDLTGKSTGWHTFTLANVTNIPTGAGAYAGLKWSVPCDPYIDTAGNTITNQFSFYSFDNGASTKPYLSISYNTPGVQHVITSNPVGRSLTVDGVGCTSPCTFQWTAGTQHTIATTSPQAGPTGTQYVFASWSDAGAISHTITASSSPATYTANFTTQYYLTTAASPPAGGTISPASGWYNSGAVVSVSATPNSGYVFSGFSGDLTGGSPQNLTMNGPKSVTANFTPLGQVQHVITTTPVVGLSVTVDGAGCTSPCTFYWTPGTSHTISTAWSYSGPPDTRYVFSTWSDGGARTHTITASSSPATYTATFTTQYLLRTAASPAAGGTISPATSWRNSGTQVQISATANSGYVFSGFSGALSGTTTPQNLTMNGPKSVTANFTATVQHVITTTPVGLSLTVEGAPCTSPCTRQWVPGTQYSIGTTLKQSLSGTWYYFSYWSDSGPMSRTITASSTPTTYTANFFSDPVEALKKCIYPSTSSTCTLATRADGQPHTVTATIEVSRLTAAFAGTQTAFTITGETGDRRQTKLVRGTAFTGPIVSVNAPTPPSGTCISGNPISCGITIQNLTICGSSTLTAGASLCPRVQTECGNMVERKTPPNVPLPTDFICEDLPVLQADTGLNTTNPDPFNYTGPYSLTLANVDLEDAAGHALSLYANATTGKKVNDIYIHDSAINNSEVTGIVYGANGVEYHTRYCDSYRDHNPYEFRDDPALFAPRNIRIENNGGATNGFRGNKTGVMGGGAVRWLALRNNTFENNYILPRVGNLAGGTVQGDWCADKVQVSGNTMTGPSSYDQTDALELYGRNIVVSGNTISGYGVEGVGAHSLLTATITGNHIQDNGWAVNTGGIKVVTSFPATACHPVPRDTDNVTVSGNTPDNPAGQTQAYGVHFQDQNPTSTARLRSVSVTSDTTPYRVVPVWLERFVGLYNYSPPDGYSLQPPRNPVPRPRALPVDVSPSPAHPLWPVPPRCFEKFANPPGTKKGSPRALFTFRASDHDGASNMWAIHGVFSLLGDDGNGQGGPNGAGMCHFAYDPVANLLYLDDANAGFTFPLSLTSVVGAGGTDVGGPGSLNPNCTIHAASSSSWKTVPPSQAQPAEYVVDLTLDIDFPASPASKYHIYTYTQSGNGLSEGDFGGVWKYWGYWWNVEQ